MNNKNTWFSKNYPENKNDIISYLEDTYPFLEVGAISGGQKVYSFIISVE